MITRFLRPASVLIATLAVIGLSRAAAGEDYPIKLQHPEKVGTEMRATVTGTSEAGRLVKKDGQKVEEVNKKTLVNLVGDEKVLEVSKDGQPTKIQCTIVKFEQTADGKTTQVLPPGKTVIAESAGDQTNFTIDGAKAPPEVAAALELVLYADNPNNPSDDETFGTSDRKKVGDTWPGKTDLIFDTLKKRGLPLQKEGFETQVKLIAVDGEGDKKQMTVQVSTAAPIEKGAQFPGFPAWLSVASGKARNVSTQTFPVDSTGLPSSNKVETSMMLTASGKAPDGSNVTIDLTMHRASNGKSELK